VSGLRRHSGPLHRRRRHAAAHHPRLRRPHPARRLGEAERHSREDRWLPEKNKITPEEISRGLEAKKIDNVWEHVNKFLAESHGHIAKCYELDAAGAFDKPTEESRAFILARCRAGAQLTLDLWYTAWVKSEKLPAHW